MSPPAPLRIMLVLSRGLTREQTSHITAGVKNVEFVFAEDTAEDITAKADALDAIINCPRDIFTAELLRRIGARLKWVHSGGAGIEAFLIPELVESDIVFTNGKIIQGPEVSDHAVMLVLALMRHLHLLLRGAPASEIPRPIELYGKTAAVIGLGGIGLLIAEKLAAFKMRVVGLDEDRVPMVSAIDRLYHPSEGYGVLGEADVVLMAAPLTHRSYRTLGAEGFTAMKQGAYFINVSRGETVDTDALVAALQSGHLAGAGLDVTDPEPLPADHPLRGLDNVIITPHIAGPSDRNRERTHGLIRQNIQLFAADQPLCNVVDKKRGY